MPDSYSGATRIIFIAGNPIAQGKSPAGVTRLLRARGADALVVPAQVRPGEPAAFLAVVERLPNVDGVIATVPHKFDLGTVRRRDAPRPLHRRGERGPPRRRGRLVRRHVRR